MTLELKDLFLKHGFNPTEIISNGKIQRFKGDDDSGTSCWYFVSEDRSSSGDVYYYGAAGDWRNRSRDIKFNTLTTSKYDDQKTLEKNYKKVERKVQESQIEIWEETSKATSLFWKMLPDVTTVEHPYLARKQITQFFGCKIELTPQGRNILVPMRDVRHKFWGFQRILENGDKRYFPGVKKSGNFHLLGEWGPKILVCEGFATGASLHMATSLPVAVAFDTYNLMEVAKEIKTHHPTSNVVLCGDDDVFTSEEKGGNNGRKKAEESASKVMGIAIFPKFKSLEHKPTDFNDLHCLEGLDTVKTQVEDGGEGIQAIIKKLGTKGGSKFFYTSTHNKNICVLDGHSEADLLKLMPVIEYWLHNFPKAGKGGGVDWQLARATLMEQCLAKGTFESEKIRGPGVWIDQSRVVVHLGDRLLVNGVFVDIASFDSAYHYELDVGFSNIHKEPLTALECTILRNVCQKFSYVHIQQMVLLGGWIALAPICGALSWRPHVWLTGEAGSGKTTIKDFIDQILEWGFKRVSVTGGTTEAGIRQRLKASAIPVVFDEFEPDGKKNFGRVTDTLDLIRQASSNQKGEILKGTQDQRGAAYQVSFMALVSSIKTSLLTEADQSRFTVVELEGGKSSLEAWKDIQAAMNEVTPEFSKRLVARMIRLIPVVRKNHSVAHDAFVSLGFSPRIGQQYGALVAGWHALESDSEWTLEQAVEFCRHIDLKLESTVSSTANPEDCLDWLLASSVRYDHNEVTVRELFTHTGLIDTEWFKGAREKFGVHVRKDGGVFIFQKNPELDKLFAESKWTHAWFQTLSRMKFIRSDSLKRGSSRASQRGLIVPTELLASE